MIARNFDAAIAAYSEAIVLNPSLAIAHLMMGSTYAYGGFPQDGLHYLALAERMSPRDFSQAAIYSTSGLCHLIAGRYDQAIAFQRRALNSVHILVRHGEPWRRRRDLQVILIPDVMHWRSVVDCNHPYR